MVKIGPKLPPPTRRQLDKLEKELKRAAQRVDGFNPNQLGEPREHLKLLLLKSKRARSKRPEIIAFSHSRRKWDKNQKRAQDRKLAKDVGQNRIAERSGRSVCSPNSDLPVGQDSQDDVDSMSQTMPVAFPGATTTHRSASSGGSPEVFVSPPESPMLDSFGGSTLLAEEVFPSPLTLGHAFQHKPEEVLVLAPLVFVPSTPCLDIGINSTDSFWNGKVLSTLSSRTLSTLKLEKEDDDQITPKMKTPVVIHPLRSLAAVQPSLPSQAPPGVSRGPFVRRSLVLVNSVAASARLSFRQENRLSKSFIFSKPLDFTEYPGKSGLKRSFLHGSASPQVNQSSAEASKNGSCTNRSTQIGFSAAAYPYSMRRPDFNEPGVNFTGPPNFLAASLSSGSKLSTLPSTVLLSGLPRTTRLEISDGLYSVQSRISGLLESATPLTPHHLGLGDVSDWDEDLVARSEGDSGSKSDTDKPVWWQDQNDLEADYGDMDVDDLFHNLAKPQRQSLVIYPDNSRLQNQQKSSMINSNLHLRPHKPSPSEAPDCHNFSSNNAKSHGIKPTDIEAASFVGGVDIPPPLVPSFANAPVAAAVITLAPAAQIFQGDSIHIAGRGFRNVQVHKANEMAKDKDRLKKNPEIRNLDLGSHTQAYSPPDNQSVNVASWSYPDTPLAPQRGIIPPVSTPASRSPLIFAMALPSPPWSRTPLLPIHVVRAPKADGSESSGFVSGVEMGY
ncbi:hypothetical protein GALMADRAFT_149447 [Galerina marginata CBS 339.88]|uniref:Uncharacterized protein n=1 Tax=Galerina marginata (strain CBS 339.88) TaxID=685588 RepID=A0A067TY40_GALM3|nr:hypothetical protein GALMADRAFT_149447 [Galerina marginata CBS 339.88]